MSLSIRKLRLEKKHVLYFSLLLLFTIGILVVWLINKKDPWTIGASATSSMTYGTPITINNPVPADGDVFGVSVSVSGDKVLIGAQHDDTGATNTGSAYLYDTSGNLLQTFNNPAPGEYDRFGWSVSISGDKVLVSAPYDNTGATYAGSAYLFDATTGALLQTFNNPTPAWNDFFGGTVSISGDKVLIGAHSDDTGAINTGSAYLYDTSGNLLQTFSNPTPATYDNFGWAVSISGDKVLIGAHNDDTGAADAGSAYLYDTSGNLLQTFNNPAPGYSDNFGYSLSISGDKVLIGARSDSAGASGAGSAYLYDTSGNLLQTFNNPAPSPSDSFGYSVSVSGDKVLIGTPGDDIGATDAGSAYLYEATTGTLLRIFNKSTPAASDGFGLSISISGDEVLIGAYLDDTGAADAGSAYLYLLQNDTDGDGLADNVDNCPADANADQADTDSDGQGNPCDFTPNGDTDGDGVDELADNCPGVANAGQEDNDADGLGNACDPTPNGELNPNPTNTDQCKQLGWIDFAFRNQGQCVTFVNTGHDSR